VARDVVQSALQRPGTPTLGAVGSSIPAKMIAKLLQYGRTGLLFKRYKREPQELCSSQLCLLSGGANDRTKSLVQIKLSQPILLYFKFFANDFHACYPSCPWITPAQFNLPQMKC
jgi:hypothetical protein